MKLCALNTSGPDAKKTEAEKTEEADAEILAAIASRRKLASDLELAKGVQYTEPLKTSYVELTVLHFVLLNVCSWRPPKFVRDRPTEQHQKLREKYHIIVEGEDVPPPIENFTVGMVNSVKLAFSHAMNRI